MSVSGIAAAAQIQPSGQQIPTSQHRHGGHRSSISDVGAQSSSAPSAGNAPGKTGGKINITV
jgi:hypothetical protein